MELITPNISPVTEDMLKWAVEGQKNNNYFDPNVLRYGATFTLVARSKSKDVLYIPIQTVFMLESLAINPDATKHEVAVALREVLVSLGLLAQRSGIGEIYFLGTNDDTNAFALKHGLEELPWRAFRMKSFIERSNENIPQVSTGPANG